MKMKWNRLHTPLLDFSEEFFSDELMSYYKSSAVSVYKLGKKFKFDFKLVNTPAPPIIKRETPFSGDSVFGTTLNMRRYPEDKDEVE